MTEGGEGVPDDNFTDDVIYGQPLNPPPVASRYGRCPVSFRLPRPPLFSFFPVALITDPLTTIKERERTEKVP